MKDLSPRNVERRARSVRRGLVCSAFSAVAAFLVVALAAQPAGEWRSYAGDLRNQHYSPLSQVTAANFNALEVVWRFKTDSLGPRPGLKLAGRPLRVTGTSSTNA